jgi:hypothetical protein
MPHYRDPTSHGATSDVDATAHLSRGHCVGGSPRERCAATLAEAGERLQPATLAIRAVIPLDALRDTIQPFPSFSEIYVPARKAFRAAMRQPVGAREP